MIKYEVGGNKKYGLYACGHGVLARSWQIAKAFDGLFATVEVLPDSANDVASCSEIRFSSLNKDSVDILLKKMSSVADNPLSEEELESIKNAKSRLEDSLTDSVTDQEIKSTFSIPAWPEEKEFYRRCIDPETGESKLVILWGIYRTGNEDLEREGIGDPGNEEIIIDPPPPLPWLKFILWLLVAVVLLAMVLWGIKSCSPESVDSETPAEIAESNDVSGVTEGANDLGGVIVDTSGVLGVGGAIVDTNTVPGGKEKVDESGGEPPVIFVSGGNPPVISVSDGEPPVISVDDDFDKERDGSSDVPVSDSLGQYSLEWVVISGEVDVELPWYGKGLPPVREWPESGFGVNVYNVIVKKDGTKVRDLKVEWLYYESE